MPRRDLGTFNSLPYVLCELYISDLHSDGKGLLARHLHTWLTIDNIAHLQLPQLLLHSSLVATLTHEV